MTFTVCQQCEGFVVGELNQNSCIQECNNGPLCALKQPTSSEQQGCENSQQTGNQNPPSNEIIS